jgi:hypothetical protein
MSPKAVVVVGRVSPTLLLRGKGTYGEGVASGRRGESSDLIGVGTGKYGAGLTRPLSSPRRGLASALTGVAFLLL